MAFTTSIKTSGGKKLEAVLKKAEDARRSKIKVGFFSDAKYDDGTQIAAVAVVNEFGLADTPERPFLRRATAELEDAVPKALRDVIDPTTMTVDGPTADRVGRLAVEVVQDAIDTLKDPPNAPSTVMLKRGDNPLVDSGQMKAAVSYETE